VRNAAACWFADFVLIWFLVTAPFLVAEIFKSPMVDYRLVAFGALLPLVELGFDTAFVLHTLLAPVLVLTAVMVTTMGSRLVRRRLLGVPIGMFFHLVLDGTWTSATLFWWPAFGLSFEGEPVPETTFIGWRLLLEVIAVAIGVVAYRRYDLADEAKRARLVKSGHLTSAWAG
jgi:hypothetical protein